MSLVKKIIGKFFRIVENREKRFLRNTSIEILKYVITDKSLPWWVKLYFIIISGLLVFAAVTLAVGIYNKWENTPVIIGSTYCTLKKKLHINFLRLSHCLQSVPI